MKIFVDGIEMISTTYSYNYMYLAGFLHIGCRRVDPGGPVEVGRLGRIHSVRIFYDDVRPGLMDMVLNW